MLSELDREIELKKMELIKSLQKSFEGIATDIDKNFTDASSTIKENVKELRGMKK